MSTREVCLEGGSPWGFRIHGGADTNQPLRVSRVNPGSGAAQRGVREGDLISTINGQPTRNLSNAEAHQLLRTAGNTLLLGLNQGSSGSPKRRAHRLQEHKEEHIEKTTTTSSTHTTTISRIETTLTTNNNENNSPNNNKTSYNCHNSKETENPQKSTTHLKNGYFTDSRGVLTEDASIESTTDGTGEHVTMAGGASRSRKRKSRSNRKKSHKKLPVDCENSTKQAVTLSDNKICDKDNDVSNVNIDKDRLESPSCSYVSNMYECRASESNSDEKSSSIEEQDGETEKSSISSADEVEKRLSEQIITSDTLEKHEVIQEEGIKQDNGLLDKFKTTLHHTFFKSSEMKSADQSNIEINNNKEIINEETHEIKTEEIKLECIDQENGTVIRNQKELIESNEATNKTVIDGTPNKIEEIINLENTGNQSNLQEDKASVLLTSESQNISESVVEVDETEITKQLKSDAEDVLNLKEAIISYIEDKYVVESPKSTKKVNGAVIKCRSFEDDDKIKIMEVLDDDEGQTEASAIITEEESDVEWETIEDLPLDNQALHYGKLSVISLPLVEHRIEHVSHISPEEENNLKNFLKTLNLGIPDEPKITDKTSDIKARKVKKQAALAQHFLPYFHNPRYLEVISEEGSDLSDNDRKTTDTIQCMSHSTRPLIINPYWPNGNPLESLTLTNEAILVGTKMVEGNDVQQPIQETSWSFISEAECSSKPEVVYLDEDSSECMTPSDLLELDNEDADGEDEESEIEKSLDDCLDQEYTITKKVIGNVDNTIKNVNNIHIFSVNSQELSSDLTTKQLEELKTDNTLECDNINLDKVSANSSLSTHEGQSNIDNDQEETETETEQDANNIILIKNLDEIIKEIEEISISPKLNIKINSAITTNDDEVDIKSIKISTSETATTDINSTNELKESINKDGSFLNDAITVISSGNAERIKSLTNDKRFNILPTGMQRTIHTLITTCLNNSLQDTDVEGLRKLINQSSEVDNEFNKEFKSFCEILIQPKQEENRPGSSSSDRSSRSTSQCTTVYNPANSSLTNIVAVLKEDSIENVQHPQSLKDLCVHKLLKMPFGTTVMEELAQVSLNIEDLTNSMYSELKHTNQSNKIHDSPTIDVSPSSDSNRMEEKWIGMPLEEDPSLSVYLSPSQKTYIETVKNTPKEADSLLDLHRKYVDRRHPENMYTYSDQNNVSISSLRVNFDRGNDFNTLSQNREHFIRRESLREAPRTSKRNSSYIDYQNFMKQFEHQNKPFIKKAKDDGNINYNSYIKKVTHDVPIQVEIHMHKPVNNLVYLEDEDIEKQRLNATHISEWLNLARKEKNDNVKIRAPLIRYRSCDGLSRSQITDKDTRRYSLPHELFEKQMQYILDKEYEVQMEIEKLEREKEKLEREHSTSLNATEKYPQTDNLHSRIPEWIENLKKETRKLVEINSTSHKFKNNKEHETQKVRNIPIQIEDDSASFSPQKRTSKKLEKKDFESSHTIKKFKKEKVEKKDFFFSHQTNTIKNSEKEYEFENFEWLDKLNKEKDDFDKDLDKWKKEIFDNFEKQQGELQAKRTALRSKFFEDFENEKKKMDKHRTCFSSTWKSDLLENLKKDKTNLEKEMFSSKSEQLNRNEDNPFSALFDPSNYQISRKGDIAIFNKHLVLPTEKIRQEMYNEWINKVQEREERKQHKVIKITCNSTNHESSETVEVKHTSGIEDEFMEKVKARLSKLGLNEEEEKIEQQEKEDKKGSKEESKPVIVIDGGKFTEATVLPKHLQEFVEYVREHSEQNGVWSPNKSTEVQHFQNEVVEKTTEHTKNKDNKDEPMPVVWTPSASPQLGRKEFKPISFESPVLGRKNRSKEPTPVTTPDSQSSIPLPWDHSQQHQAQDKSRIQEQSRVQEQSRTQEQSKAQEQSRTQEQFKTQEESTSVQDRIQEFKKEEKRIQERRILSTSHSAPSAGLSALAGKLPKAQNPTITLLQKAREGQLPKGASYIEESTQSNQRRSKDDRPPLIGPHDILYTIKSEYTKEVSDSEQPKKMADLGSRKFEGIGPTTKDGMPIILRSEVKDANQHKWYKRMYETLHKAKNDDEYVTVRYKTRRGRYPYTSAGGYLSEPEPNAYDSDASQTSSKYATLDRRRMMATGGKQNEFITYTVPRSNRYMSASVRHTNEVYKNQPGRIENYVPGHSSISEKEAKEWWDEVMEIFDGHLEQQKHVPQKSFMSHALKESGYESDSQLVFRRREDAAAAQQPNPIEQRQAYREIQRGGEVPLHGLRKPAPERPKEPTPAPTPPPKGYHGFSDRDEESPRRYVENEVTIHYRAPVRHELKEIVSEEELARRQADAMRRIYQEERRRKYLQELQDMNSRRHTDNFTPSQKSPIPLNRYDDFLDEVGGPITTSVRENSPEPRLVARALYNFVGQTSRELTFRKGDVIFIRRQVDKNWYEGEHNAMVGLFPANYVEIVPFEKSRPTTRKAHEGQARAKFNFIAQTQLELSLAKGELVVLTRRVDNNWFEGRIGNRRGIFPVSYVEVLIDPRGSDQIQRTEVSKPVASPAAHSLVVNGGTGGSHSYQQGAYKGGVSGSFHAKPVQLTGSLTRSQRTAVNEVLHIDTHNEPVPYRAMYKYRPQNDDELELMEGDTVFVLEKCDDGWYVGSSQRTGAFGTFPGNYVERI